MDTSSWEDGPDLPFTMVSAASVKTGKSRGVNGLVSTDYTVRKTRSIHGYKNLLTNGEISIRLSPNRALRAKGKLDQPAKVLFV